MSVKRYVLAMAAAMIPVGAECAPDQVFFGYLSGINEWPPVVTAGTGFALVTYSPDTSMMRVQVTFANLNSGSSVAHIHCCFSPPTTMTAIVATTTPTFTDFPSGVTAGTYDHTFDMTMAGSYSPGFVTAQGSVSAALNAILVGMTNSTAYFNIHTQTNGAGEIRANMKPDAVFADGFEQAAG